MSRSRIVSSVSFTNFFAETSNAWRKVKLRSCSARTICSDCTRSSAVFQTSTSAASSVVLRVVSGVATCSFAPKKTRLPSSLQASAARSLTTQPLGNPSAFAGSSTTGGGTAAPSLSAAATSRNASSTLSFSRIFSTSLPFSTAIALPSSLQVRRL